MSRCASPASAWAGGRTCSPTRSSARASFDRRLLHALGAKAPGIRREVRLPGGAELRGDPRRPGDRGDHQHDAEQRASSRRRRGRRSRQARVPRQADRQHRRRRPRHHRGLPQGRRGARARLPAAAREPFPLDQREHRRGRVRQAGQRRGQHQPRPPRQDRSHLVALYRRGHAGRRHAADRHPLHRRARIPHRADHGGQRALRAAGAARRQPRRREPRARARERRALDAERELRLGLRVLPDEHLRQGSERVLRPARRPARAEAGRDPPGRRRVRQERRFRRGARGIRAGLPRRGEAGDGRRARDELACRDPRRHRVGARGAARRGRRDPARKQMPGRKPG